MAGLKANELKALQRLANRRYDVHTGYTLEQAKELGALSRLISRQIGLLIDRQGKVELTIVGDAHGILIPTLARERSTGRLRGIRLLHTHLTDSKLSGEDLMDLLFLRLDSIGVLTVDEFGAPVHFQSAHLLPALISDESYIRDISKSKTFKKQKQLEYLEEKQDNPPLRAEDIDFILTQNLYHADIEPKPLTPERPAEPYRITEFFVWDKNPLDLSAEIDAIEEEFARLIKDSHSTENSKNFSQYKAKGQIETFQAGSRCVLVSVSKAPKAIQERNLAELTELARTAGLGVAGNLIQRVTTINPRQILSQNKLAELEVIALQGHAGIIIFDGELSPAQLQNLAELTERKVLDRTQLILVFLLSMLKPVQANCKWKWHSSNIHNPDWWEKIGLWTGSWAVLADGVPVKQSLKPTGGVSGIELPKLKLSWKISKNSVRQTAPNAAAVICQWLPWWGIPMRENPHSSIS